MARPVDPKLQQKLDWMLEDLCREFEASFSREQVEEVVGDSLERFMDGATVKDFVPLLTARFARERLHARVRARSEHPADTWDIVYVSLSGGGRGQLAAALTTMMSGGQVTVHSAGTAVQGEIDPAVRSVIAELGLDPDEAYARPVTREVLDAADVIVTMGHSVGKFERPPGVRTVDWRVGDPLGAEVEEVRRVRADIEHRVRDLLAELGALAEASAGTA